MIPARVNLPPLYIFQPPLLYTGFCPFKLNFTIDYFIKGNGKCFAHTPVTGNSFCKDLTRPFSGDGRQHKSIAGMF
jgi:hypothetical protein